MQELGTELTIPKGSPLFQSIKYVKTFELSLASLLMHQVYSVNKWKPHNAILKSFKANGDKNICIK